MYLVLLPIHRKCKLLKVMAFNNFAISVTMSLGITTLIVLVEVVLLLWMTVSHNYNGLRHYPFFRGCTKGVYDDWTA